MSKEKVTFEYAKRILTIKAIRDMIQPHYGMDALSKAKEIYDLSFKRAVWIVERDIKGEI